MLLLDGLEMRKMHKHIRIQELGLLKSAFFPDPKTRSVYKYLIDCFFVGICDKVKAILHPVLSTCEEWSISFVQYICSDSYSNQCNTKL